MASSILRGAALVAASALFAAGFGVNQGHAQSGKAQTEKADKQKSTEKKNTAKQGTTQTTNGQPAPMSGFRPDPQTNY
jgi:hypothetical protein